MPSINIFNQKRAETEFKVILSLAGRDIYRNGQKERAVITNSTYMKSFEEKFLTTIQPTNQGDLIKYDERYWLITSQGQRRYESFKAIIQPCEHDIIFNLATIKNKPTKYLLKVPAIISQTSDFNLSYNRANSIINVNGEIHIFIPHTEDTKPVLDLQDHRVIFGNRAWKIAGISTVKKGLLDLTCQLTTSQKTDNLAAGIENCPDGFEKLINLSMYRIFDGNSKPALPEADSKTVLEFISFTDGLLVFSEDAQKEQFKEAFIGYKITPYIEEMVWGMDEPTLIKGDPFEVTEEQAEIKNLPVEVSAVYDDGEERLILAPVKFEKPTF